MRPVVVIPWWIALPVGVCVATIVFGALLVAAEVLVVIGAVWLVGWLLWRGAESGAGAALRARDRRERAYYRERRLRKKGHL